MERQAGQSVWALMLFDRTRIIGDEANPTSMRGDAARIRLVVLSQKIAPRRVGPRWEGRALGEERVEARRVSESETTMGQVMLPSDANSQGNVHGGTIMKLADTAGGVVAMRHCRCRVVTARMDEMSFLHPVYVGDLVTLRASLNAVGRSSMEVGVRVEAENTRTGEVTHTGVAYLVYVALDEDGGRVEVPRLIVETEEERRRMVEAEARMARRRRMREQREES
jgi:acyl-CoA hydrolase